MQPSVHELQSLFNYWDSDDEDRGPQSPVIDFGGGGPDDDADTLSVASDVRLLSDSEVDSDIDYLGVATPRTLDGEAEVDEARLGKPHSNSDGDGSKASNLSTYFNIVCIIAGTGILQLPYALSEGGWSAVLLIALAALMSNFTANATVRCLYYKPGRRLDGYSEAANEAFGPRGRQFVSFFKSATLTAASALFIILAATNITQLLQHTALSHLGLGFWIKLSALFAWTPLVLKRSIHEVSVLSMFGTLSTVVMVLVVCYICGRDIAGTGVDIGALKAFDIKKYPMALSSIFFSYGGNFMFPEVEAGMRYPRSFERVQGAASITVFLMYALVAVIGYAAYGTGTKSPVFLNMESGPLLILANSMVTVHVLFTAPIMMASVCMNLEQDLNIIPESKPRTEQRTRRFLFRTSMMLVVFCLAYYCPFFGDLVQLIGAFAESLLVFVLPALFYLILQSKRRTLPLMTRIWCGMVVAVGMYCCIAGTWSGLVSLYTHIREAQAHSA